MNFLKHNSWDLLRPLENENDWYFPDGFAVYCERINEQVSPIHADVLEQWVYKLYADKNVVEEFGGIDYHNIILNSESG